MPAVSQKQQKFMAICEHDPQHAQGKCPNMTHQQMHDFAATPRKGLPVKADSSGKKKLKQKMTSGKSGGTVGGPTLGGGSMGIGFSSGSGGF